MMHKTITPRRTLIALALVPALGAAEVDTSDWACESCPFDDGYRANVDVGAIAIDDDQARFGNYTGFDEKGTYANVNGHGRYNGDGYRVDYVIEDLGLDSRAFDMSIGSEGLFEFRVGYRDLPYRRFDTTRSVFDASTGNVLSLPSGWVAAGTTDQMTQLSSSQQTTPIGTDRQILDVGVDWNASDAFTLFAEFRRQKRDGIDIASGTSFAQSAFLPRWIDFETDRIDAGVRYTTENTSLTLGYYGSFFTNKNASLFWETPFAASPATSRLQMAREPGNDFSQVSLSGTYLVDQWDTVLAFSAATGRGEQNEALLPYTINPDIVTTALPTTALDAQVDTIDYAFTVTSRPLDKVRVKFAYRYDERDNKTPVYDWNRVIVDLLSSGDVEQNTPYSYDRGHMTLSGEYMFSRELRVSAGYERREVNRDNQEVAEQITDTGWGQLRWKPAAWLDLRAKGGASRRGVERYDETVAVSFGQNPLLRKYNLAYRYREFGEVVATITPAESPLSFAASALFADDDYKDSLVGMNGSEEFRATFDASWAVSESAAVYFVWGRDAIDAHQTGAENFGFWDWSAFHEDTFDHVGAGMSWRPDDGKLGFSLSYDRGTGETKIMLDSLSGGRSDLPTLESTLDAARAEASYAFSDRLDATFELRYERFDLKDFALVSQTTLPGILTLGAEPYDYDVVAFGIGIRYRFGTEKITLVE
ncbi:MAG: MtrB/PioB family decaheme-associated outer membrane protein [Woeseiaceae bacterium]|nr:MtrB/PioB family decaheme-associated outer membrane protein [Woeseiaceae bacterium]